MIPQNQKIHKKGQKSKNLRKSPTIFCFVFKSESFKEEEKLKVMLFS